MDGCPTLVDVSSSLQRSRMPAPVPMKGEMVFRQTLRIAVVLCVVLVQRFGLHPAAAAVTPTIDAFAGNGTAGSGGNGAAATSAQLQPPSTRVRRDPWRSLRSCVGRETSPSQSQQR